MSRAHQQRISLQVEDFVRARGDLVGELEHGAEVVQVRFPPTRGPGSQGPVVDDLDVGCDRGGIAIEVERRHPPDRARRRRRAGARGAVGEELGVALVQAGDGVAQPVGGEALPPSDSSLRVGLGDNDLHHLVGADIELAAGEPAG